jgi:hypothetical protein
VCIAILAPTICLPRVQGQPGRIGRIAPTGMRSSSVEDLSTSVALDKSWSIITLQWRTRGVKHHQNIRFPAPWHYGDVKDKSYRPPWIQFEVSGEPAIMFVATRPSGVYDVRAPIFYRLNNGIWRPIKSVPKIMEFTDRGSCYVSKGRLFAWDYEMAEHRGHADPQRYWLREFSISSRRIHLKSTRITKNGYNGIEDDMGQSSKIRPSDDPLHEFGLHWKWWGESASPTLPMGYVR